MKRFEGLANNTAHFLQNEHLCDRTLWRKFVDVYRSQPDGENGGWRGEFWGKMMRGAALVYEYTKDETLYGVLSETVDDMITVAEEDGRVSSYTRESEFEHWDIWGRKYAILGCEYYLEICKDEAQKARVIAFIRACADYIIGKIGDGEGKKKITRASSAWYGINSSSILEPMVRLYVLTGEKKYLDFSSYIVELGGAEDVNVFALAYENRLYPYQYGVSKAYEMTSCFEGLLEYYKVTGVEKYKIAVENYARAVLESEVSIIGGSGMTHELFDHTRTRQTVRYDGVIHETCVAVTLMKFFSRVLELTGDSVYADFIEKAFYNTYLGALNTEHRESSYVHERFADKKIIHTDLPFDSYCPLTPAKRGRVVGGTQVLPDMSYYGCCASIGAAGVGIFLKHAVVEKDGEVTLNFYERSKSELLVRGVLVSIEVDGDYPVDGNIKVRVKSERPVSFTLKLRNPEWSNKPAGYTSYTREWSDDTIELCFDMSIKLHYPEYWENDTVYTDMDAFPKGYYAAVPVDVSHQAQEDNYVAVTRGPLTLAADSRTGKDASSVFCVSTKAKTCEPFIVDGVECLVKLEFETDDGERFYLVDYAHAGRDWDTTIAAWLPTAKNES